MPDGRVWTAGSDRNGQQGRPNLEPRIEILEPPYIGNPNRPQIIHVDAATIPGAAFRVETPQARSIRRISLLRAGSVTHAFSSDQRYVELEFSVTSDNELRVTAPPKYEIAPPGFYLLFLLNSEVIPSEGVFIHMMTPREKQIKDNLLETKGKDVADGKLQKDLKETIKEKDLVDGKHPKDGKETIKEKDVVDGKQHKEIKDLDGISSRAPSLSTLTSDAESQRAEPSTGVGRPFIRPHERPDVGVLALDYTDGPKT
jgi:hypothetical protein